MAINFPDNPTNGQVVLVGGKNYTYNSTKNTWTPTQVTEADLSTVGSTTVVATHDLLPSSPSAGDMALVSSVNKMYVYFLSGWWLMSSLQNASPSGITGNAALYNLATDGTPTTVTLSSSDPEGFPISWSHSIISGSLGGTTVTNVDNVFTITPSTTEADAGTFTLRFAASDGQGGESGSQSQFTLDFVFIVANSRYTTLLTTAVDTSDNNNIADSSSNNRSITVNGDAYAGTFSPYRSRGYSTYFEDTAANVLYASPSSDFAFGTGAFTISVWVKILHSYGGTIFDTNDGSNVGATMEISGSGFSVHSGTSYTQLASISSSNQNVWQHFCWTRDGSGNNKIFVNGTQSTTFTNSTNYTSQNFKMGERQNGAQDLKAYVKDLHIVKGYANEPDSTYADGAAEAGTGTVFLGCSLPYHGDKSSSPKTLTVASSGISIVNDTPHNYLEYSATDHGGSVYFGGGTREHLSTSLPAFGTQDFEVEFWIYGGALTSNTWYTLFSRDYNVNGSFRIYCSGGSGELDEFIYIANGTEYNNTSAGKIKDNVWNHILLSRVSGTAKWFINGIADTSWSDSENMTSTATLYIGDTGADETSNSSYPFEGYMSDIAIRIGGSGYRTSSFTPPTAPLSSTGAELHLKGTDASIIDKSQGTNLALFGNTTGSTTQVKFADTKSMYFDGSGDYISIPADDSIFSKDYTIEFWMYPTQDTNLLMPFSKSAGLQFYHQSGNIAAAMSVSNSGTYFYNGNFGSITTNAWSHISLVRDSSANTYKFYINGTLEDTLSSSSNISAGAADWTIGGYLGTSFNFQGYIQDLRVTEGLARYTSNFTPPTEPLEG